MMFRFCLLFLVAAVLSAQSGGAGKSAIPGLNSEEKAFRWVRVKFNAFLLIWNKEQMIERSVQTVEVHYAPADDQERLASRAASVDRGNLLIDRLYPNTLYSFKIFAMNGDRAVLNYSTLLKSWPTAPVPVLPPRGKAISSTQIKLRWVKPTYPNGILQPYRVTCLPSTSGGTPISVFTRANTTTAIILGNLQPNIAYRCRVEASTYPAKKQDPKKCATESELSPPIVTKPAG